MTEQPVVDPPVIDAPPRPMCPRCKTNPTEVTVPMDEEGNSWQDICGQCGAKAQKKDKELEVVPIAVPDDQQ